MPVKSKVKILQKGLWHKMKQGKVRNTSQTFPCVISCRRPFCDLLRIYEQLQFFFISTQKKEQLLRFGHSEQGREVWKNLPLKFDTTEYITSNSRERFFFFKFCVLLRTSKLYKQCLPYWYGESVVSNSSGRFFSNFGTIPILRQYIFGLFWPAYPPYVSMNSTERQENGNHIPFREQCL